MNIQAMFSGLVCVSLYSVFSTLRAFSKDLLLWMNTHFRVPSLQFLQVQKKRVLKTYFSLMQSHLCIFAFVVSAFGVKFLKKSRNFPLCSSRSFMFSSLKFKSSINFELIFVYGVRDGSSFILWHVALQFSQHHLLRRLSFPYCIFLAHLS